VLAAQLTESQLVPTTEAPPGNVNLATSQAFRFCHEPVPDALAWIRSVTTLT